ncbi:hypothetical protein [Spirillospora sp. CA-294931]|uniref:hypothetical protein n=1 Tax=Spirillospora sp. CA-294931 TaxID=3240042 RepID=UPI003D90A381
MTPRRVGRPTASVTVRLPVELKAWLDSQAEDQFTTVTEVIKTILIKEWKAQTRDDG